MLSEESPWRRLRFSRDTVIDTLKFTVTPPLKIAASEFNNLTLNCKAQGALEITGRGPTKIFLKTTFLFQTERCFSNR